MVLRVAIGVCVVLGLAGCGGGSAPSANRISTSRPALWIGDSYTAGAGANSSATGEAYPTSEGLGWRHTYLDAQGGTGFVAGAHAARPDYKPVPARLKYDTALDPDPGVVVIDAGRNDRGHQKARVRRTVVTYFKSLARAFPTSAIVVIAPFLMRSRPHDYAFLRHLLAGQAHARGWAFVDPLAEGWVNSTSAKLVTFDGVHPNQEGYNYIVAHLGPAISNALAAAHES